ncbi:MAG: hypothetical protein OXS28_06570 [Gammaproteobacteria bacterium]|nr:hypothetical protein [Gammaproteobacteria bacterium]
MKVQTGSLISPEPTRRQPAQQAPAGRQAQRGVDGLRDGAGKRDATTPASQVGKMDGYTVTVLAGRHNVETVENQPGKGNVVADILRSAGQPPAHGLQRDGGFEHVYSSRATLENRVALSSHGFAALDEGIQQAIAARSARPKQGAPVDTASARRDTGEKQLHLAPSFSPSLNESFSEVEFMASDAQPADLPTVSPPGREFSPRDTSLYWKGLTKSADPGLGMKTVTLFKQHPRKGLAFLAGKVNPNKFGGIIKNLFKIISSPFSARKALKQNCMSCAKAVDANLAELTSPGKKHDNIKFYQTKMASEGALDQEHRHPKDDMVVLDGRINAVRWLSEKVPAGKTAIITMPVKNRGFSHAMNLLHANNGKLFVIDGQNGKTYDLSEAGDRQRFESKYCNAGRRGHPAVVNFFLTGAAPDLE